jgi:amidophosphoribosyltransferase
VRHANVYGIDMPTREELVAYGRDIEEIRAFIGADALVYQDLEAMKRVVATLNPRLDGFEASCFDGRYITGDLGAEQLERLEAGRHAQPAEEDDPARGRLALHAAGEGQA